VKNLSAVILVLLCSLFGVSCIVDAELIDTGEPAGEAQQELPVVINFDPSDFPFATIVEYSGGLAGGWQRARANLKFWRVSVPTRVIQWTCPITVEMPRRTQFMGKISSSRAAKLSVEITEDVARSMDYKLPQGIFCRTFVAEVDARFKSRYPLLGARATL
jgi:hypothetical protein